jgi:hypothetical protein
MFGCLCPFGRNLLADRRPCVHKAICFICSTVGGKESAYMDRSPKEGIRYGKKCSQVNRICRSSGGNKALLHSSHKMSIVLQSD